MKSILNITIGNSGQFVFVPNPAQVLSGDTLQTAYTFYYTGVNSTLAGAPRSATISVQGVINATGDAVVLDTYTGTANTSRSISLSANYDSFILTGTWVGGYRVSVGCMVTSIG